MGNKRFEFVTKANTDLKMRIGLVSVCCHIIRDNNSHSLVREWQNE